jgi:hypothetical protein
MLSKEPIEPHRRMKPSRRLAEAKLRRCKDWTK